MDVIYLQKYDHLSGEKKHKVQHMLGLDLLRYGLKEQFSLDVTREWLEAHMAVGKGKKPFIREYPRLHFNISHCEGMAACAFSGQPVGVDIEHIRPVSDALVCKALTREEKEFFDFITADSAGTPDGISTGIPAESPAGSADHPDQAGRVQTMQDAGQEWFFRFWTLKESYLKYTGDGLTRDLKSFSFTFKKGCSRMPWLISCSEQDTALHQWILSDRFILSVCTREKADFSLRYPQLTAGPGRQQASVR